MAAGQVSRVDVVVVGGGLAGTVSALRAQQQGRSVLLVEKGDDAAKSGSSAQSSGIVHVALEPIPDDPKAILERIVATTDGLTRTDVAEAFATNCMPAIDWFRGQGVLLNEQETGHLRILPTRSYANASDWRAAGVSTVLADLQSRLVDLGGAIAPSTKALHLVSSDESGRIMGIRVRNNGSERTIGCESVVFADGGFKGNPALVATYIGQFADQMLIRGARGDTGDALRMGLEIGAKAVRLQYFYGHLVHRDALTSERLWPVPVIDQLLGGAVIVDPTGARFVDESLGGIAVTNVIARRERLNENWLITSERAWEEQGAIQYLGIGAATPNPGLVDRGAEMLRAASIEELAGMAGMEVGALDRSVRECEKGLEPPFVGIPVAPGITLTMGGLLINGNAQVLDTEEQPIPGLYAAGGSAGGLQGGPRGGYIGGLSPALVLGYIAGSQA